MNGSREAERQQRLLGAISRSTAPAALADWARDGLHFGRGLQVYQANAGALAERALAAAYPVVAELLGLESFAQLARALWQQQPPTQGDVATWGAALAQLLADAEGGVDAQSLPSPSFPPSTPSTPSTPFPPYLRYLPDVARLEWAVHLAACAADAAAAPGAFDRLADTDPAALWLQPRPGTALLQSLHPVASIWRAHQEEVEEVEVVAATADRFADVRAALARGQAESALVWRQGWRVHVAALDASDAAFTHALLQGQTLGAALSGLSDRPGFDFEAWLVATLTRGWLLGASAVKPGIA